MREPSPFVAGAPDDHRTGKALLSYAAPEDRWLKQTAIRLVERFTGQPRIVRIYDEARRIRTPDDDIWALAIRGLDITVVHSAARLACVPRDGPLVVVANHPFGVIDGLVLCHLISAVRGDLKVMAMSTLCRVPEVGAYVLPINFAETRDAALTSARSRRAAKAHLAAGGTLIIFPAGAVSSPPRPFTPAEDSAWHPFVGKLILGARAAVLPVRFEGQNSRLFRLVSRVSPTLRLSLLMKEMASRIGGTVHAHVGEVLPFDDLRPLGDPKALVDHLRRVTYGTTAAP